MALSIDSVYCKGKKLALAVAASFALLSSASFAAPINPAGGDFGTLLAPSTNDFNGAVQQGVSQPNFEDTYTFTLAQNSNVHVEITEYENFSFFGTVWGIRKIGGSIAGGSTTGIGTDFTVAGLTTGDYELTIGGEIKSLGIFEYGYAGELSVAAVPLPAAAWLFISALGGLVVAKRKKHRA